MVRVIHAIPCNGIIPKEHRTLLIFEHFQFEKHFIKHSKYSCVSIFTIYFFLQKIIDINNINNININIK